MKKPLLLAWSFLLLAAAAPAQVPPLLNYQGRVVVGTTNFDGPGQFKFVLTNGAGTTYYWTSDGSVVAPPNAPTNAVSLTVTKGLYSVLLGDSSIPNMTAIPASVFANPDVRLRVFFNDGTPNGFQLLMPDQRIAPNGYLADGAVTGAKIATSAVGSTQLGPNAVQSGNIASGAVGSTQLAAGAVGSAQIAAGAVDTAQLSAAIASGLWTASGSNVYRSGGNVGIGTATPKHKLDVNGNIWLGTAANGAVFTEVGDTLYLGSQRKFLSSTLGAPVAGTNDWVNLMAHPFSQGILFGTSGPGDTDPHSAPNPLMVIKSGGNVGIGTVTPGSKLDVAGTANVSGNATFGGNTAVSGSTTVGGNLFVTGPSSRFGLNTTGFANVTATLQARATDAALLDLLNSAGTQVFLLDTVGNTTTSGTASVLGNTITAGSSVIGGSLAVGTSTAAPIARIDVFGDGWFRGASGNLPSTASKGVRVFYDTTLSLGSIFAYDYTNNVPLNLELQGNGGKVGIGTSTPAATLDVTGNVHISTNAVVDGALITGGASVTTLGVSGNTTIGGTLTATGDTSIGGGLTAGSTSAGVVLNGHTSVNSPVNNAALNVKRFASGEFAANFTREDAQPFVQIGDGLPGRAFFANRGTGTILRSDGSSSWDTPSDLRLKHDVLPVTGALATLARLRPVRYRYNADFLAKMHGAPDIEHFGVVAQEFQQVFPDFVDEGKDGMLSVRMDPIPIVTAAAVQELAAQVKERDARIDALEKKNNDMEARLRALEARLK